LKFNSSHKGKHAVSLRYKALSHKICYARCELY